MSDASDERGARPPKDPFLIFLLVSNLPILFPVTRFTRVEAAFFFLWRFVQIGALVWTLGYILLLAARRCTWPQRIFVGVMLVVAVLAACDYNEMFWDSVVLYDRLVLLAFQHHGLWQGIVHGGTPYIIGYPPGSSLSVLWYKTLGLPTANMANVAVTYLWLASFTVRYLAPTRRWTGMLILTAVIAYFPTLWWTLLYFNNNLLYALLWASVIGVALLGQRSSLAELCGYAVCLIWLRPQFELTVIPIVSAGAIYLVRGNRWRPIVLMTVAALVCANLGARLWRHDADRLTALQAEHDAQLRVRSAVGQDPAVLAVHLPAFHADAPATPHAPPPRSPREVERVAIRWAWKESYRWNDRPILLMAALSLIAFALGLRRGLAHLVPWLTLAGFIGGTAIFAKAYPDYQSIGGSMERMEIVLPLLAGMMAVALDAELAALWTASASRRTDA